MRRGRRVRDHRRRGNSGLAHQCAQHDPARRPRRSRAAARSSAPVALAKTSPPPDPSRPSGARAMPSTTSSMNERPGISGRPVAAAGRSASDGPTAARSRRNQGSGCMGHGREPKPPTHTKRRRTDRGRLLISTADRGGHSAGEGGGRRLHQARASASSGRGRLGVAQSPADQGERRPVEITIAFEARQGRRRFRQRDWPPAPRKCTRRSAAGFGPSSCRPHGDRVDHEGRPEVRRRVTKNTITDDGEVEVIDAGGRLSSMAKSDSSGL